MGDQHEDDNRAPLSEYDPTYCIGRRVAAKCAKCDGQGTVWVPEDFELDDNDRQWYEQRCEACRGWGYFTEPIPDDISQWVKQDCGECDSGAVMAHTSIGAGPVHAWYDACPRCGGSGFLLVPPNEAKIADNEENAPF